jgi:NAD(P)-dependent dehydrogenase (short-subunit alcohol dehydrogenase family)
MSRVHGAGRNFYGDMLNSNLAAMQQLIDTNFFGPVRVLRAAFPLLPKQGSSSVLGEVGQLN